MDNIVYLSNKALLLILQLSALPVLVATVVGLIIALIQGVTHIQEQTLPFGIKLLAVCITLFMSSPWIVAALKNFSLEVFQMAFAIH